MKKVLLKEKVMVFLLLLYFHGFDKLLYLILGKITSKTEVKFLLSGLFWNQIRWYHLDSQCRYFLNFVRLRSGRNKIEILWIKLKYDPMLSSPNLLHRYHKWSKTIEANVKLYKYCFCANTENIMHMNISHIVINIQKLISCTTSSRLV